MGLDVHHVLLVCGQVSWAAAKIRTSPGSKAPALSHKAIGDRVLHSDEASRAGAVPSLTAFCGLGQVLFRGL